MVLNKLILSLVFLCLISLASAEITFGESNTESILNLQPHTPAVNYSLQNVNNSQFLQGNTPADFAGSEWGYNQTEPAIDYADNTFLRNDGDTGTGDYDIDGDFNVTGNVNVGDGSSSLNSLISGSGDTYFNLVAGFFGIGTSTPEFPLHIYNATDNVDIKIETGNTDGQAGFRLENDAQEWRFHINTADEFNVRDINAGTDPFTFEPGSPSDSFRIDSAGFIGLGTGNPLYKLDLVTASATNQYIRNRVNNAVGDPALHFRTNNNSWIVGIDNSDSDKLKIAGSDDLASSTYLDINTNGDVNISQGNLDVAGNISGFPAWTGWADYVDTEYNTSARFLANDSVQTTFPNNAGTIRDSQKPLDIDTFYNSTNLTIKGRNGDAYNIGIRFTAEPQAVNVYCQFVYDIGGAVGELEARTITFPKGNGIEAKYKFSADEYTLDTWEANGATVKVTCDGGDVEFWDISYEVFRVHKAR